MTLPLTPDVLRANYDFLNATEPFRRWNLPDGEDVDFRVTRSPENAGRHWVEDGRHVIEVSSRLIGYTQSLCCVMAHEMIHVHERHTRGASSCGEHGAAFKKWAEMVCRHHGFDPKSF